MNPYHYIKSVQKIILHKGLVNSLSPTAYQVTQLKQLKYSYINTNNLFNADRYSWVNNLKITNSMTLANYSPPLFFGKFHFSTKKDQEKRAQGILERMQLYKKAHLVMMDGHGRMLWSILNHMEVTKIPLNMYDFTLVDSTINVTEWHKNFLPKDITYVTCDIMDLYLDNWVGSYDHYLYLNFCGTYGERDKILMCAHKLIMMKIPFIIGFSLRSKSREFFTKNKSLTNVGLQSILIKMGCDVLCRNGMYVTLCYDIK